MSGGVTLGGGLLCAPHRVGEVAAHDMHGAAAALCLGLHVWKPVSAAAWRAAAGEPMVPVSWQEMQCPRTKAVEKRKVAKTV